MSTVGYIVRDMTGTTQHGNFAEGTPATIDATYSKDVSLNLGPSDVESYARRGSDLHITLANGDVLILDSYYDTDATGGKNLFLSEEGDFIEVVLEDRAQGMLFASYEPLDLAGKWSAYDEMVFLDIDRIEPVVAPLIAAPLLGGFGATAAGAAVVGGAAVLAGGGDDGGGDTTPPTVTVTSGTQSTGDIVNSDELTNNPVITGTGEAGATVSVEINGTTHTTIVDNSGNWSVTFNNSEISTGDYDTTITIITTDTSGNSTTSTDILSVDTVAPTVTINIIEGDNIVNAAEVSDGVLLSGTGEAGSTVSIEINGTTHSTTVTTGGSWSITFASSEFSSGEYTTTVTTTTTDIAGNITVSTSSLTVDTIAPTVGFNTVEGDNIINATEASGGVILSGSGEAGASISVVFEGQTQTTTVASNGTWSVGYSSSTITAGTYSSTISVTTTDTAGNSSTSTQVITIDTETSSSIDATLAGDNIINASEQSAGVTLTGTAEAGATVVVTLASVSHTVIADSSGNWSSVFASSEIASGTYSTSVSVVSTDLAGNTSSSSSTVAVDTETSVTIDTGLAGGDNTVSMAEAQAGVTFTGTAEAGSTVVVLVNGESRTVTANASGNWSALFESGSIATGDYTTSVSVTSTDLAGNTATQTSALTVDTNVDEPVLRNVTLYGNDVEEIKIFGNTDSYTVNTLDGSGTIGTPSLTQSTDASGNAEFTFASAVSDGTHLVVTAEDTVGNTSSTLLVLEDNANESGTTDSSALSAFNIESLDLIYSANVDLTLTEADINALSNNSDTVTIHGGADDQVTISGAVDTGTNQTINGDTYDVYTIGSNGTTLVIEDDINVII